ncbi:tubulin folding cofactor A [Lecanicillium sp. MT-2017a]|nr:tubulin folding cofactor A [Lecanicillium sp. MT-2017a]
MPPPSPLAIATGSVQRLVKEEASYHKELVDQEKELQAAEEKIKAGQDDEDGNASFMVKQQTKAVFGPLKTRIDAAVAKLEEQLAAAEQQGGSPEKEIAVAKSALADAKKA